MYNEGIYRWEILIAQRYFAAIVIGIKGKAAESIDKTHK